MKTPDKYKIDLAQWKRKEHYEFFKGFEQPFFGVTVHLNCTEAYHYCKAFHTSFLFYYLYKSLQAANQVREFRYRIEGSEVMEYSNISGSITVFRKDETFGFAYFDYADDFQTFATQAKQQIDQEKLSCGLTIKPDLHSLIHYSVLPGIAFTSFQHAHLLSVGDSVPKIVFGKLRFETGQVLLPVSVHVYHALCDGFHVSQFLESYQKLLNIT
jgi:chloramphenicol O-acetyltransferase type A